MSSVIHIAAIVVASIGIIGCIVPLIPGPVVALGGMFLLLLGGGTPPSSEMLVWFSAGCAVVTAADYFFPPMIARRFGGGKSGAWGSLVGTIVGMSFFPIGVLFGGFIGAMLFEHIFANKDWSASAFAGLGAFLGFLFGTAAKIAYCVWVLITLLKM